MFQSPDEDFARQVRQKLLASQLVTEAAPRHKQTFEQAFHIGLRYVSFPIFNLAASPKLILCRVCVVETQNVVFVAALPLHCPRYFLLKRYAILKEDGLDILVVPTWEIAQGKCPEREHEAHWLWIRDANNYYFDFGGIGGYEIHAYDVR